MKRILFLLMFSFFVTAQVDDAYLDDAYLEEDAEDLLLEEEGGSADVESDEKQTHDDILEEDIIEEPASEVADEPALEVADEPAPEVTDEPVPEVADEPVPEVTDEPVPEIIDEPVPEVIDEPAVSGERHSPAVIQRQSLPDDQPAEPVAAPPPAAKAPADKTKVLVSSSPELDEAKVGETPDIPLFSHKSHIEDIGAECVQCHQTLFAESVRGIKTGPSMKEICSQCHNGTDAPAELLAGFSDEKKYVRQEMKLFSHTTHIEHTEKCVTCHRDIYGELKKIEKIPPMSLCMECHNNHQADADCRVCHEDMAELKPRSHTARWVYRNGHGNRARYAVDKCAECHAERECTQCHRGQTSFSVHRPGYRYSHSMDARQRTVNCSYCHETEFTCVQCHSRKH